MEIFISRNGERFGPYSLEQVQEMMAADKLSSTDLAWFEGKDDWTPVSQLPEFVPTAAFRLIQTPSSQPVPVRPVEVKEDEPKGYQESRKKSLIKRGIGGLFVLFGIGFLFLLNLQQFQEGKVGLILWAVFCLSGGIWWFLGKGEQHMIPLRARLALIFALFLGMVLPSCYEPVLRVFGPQVALNVIAAVFIVLGIPTLAFGHIARAQIKHSPTFRGMGRTNTGLAIGYISLIFSVLTGLSLYEAITSPETAIVEGGATEPGEGGESALEATDDILGVAWNAREFGEWKGQWIRRRNSNIFDVTLKDGERGGTKTFIAVVSRKGNAVHIESQNSSDGRNSVYNGEISADGKTVAGTYTCAGGGPYQWSANIDPLIQAKAPEGIFFLVKSISFTTDSGVLGFPQGTKVERIEDKGEILRVRAATAQFDIPKDYLTDDLNLAQSLYREEKNARTAFSEKLHRQNIEIERAKQEEWKRAEAERQGNSSANWAPTVVYSAESNPLNRGSYDERKAFRTYNVSTPSGNSSSGGITATQQQQQIERMRRAQEEALRSQIQMQKMQEQTLDPRSSKAKDAQRSRHRAEDALRELQRR